MGAGSSRKTGAIAGLLFLALSLTGCKLGGVDLPYTVTVEQPYITASKTLAAPGDLVTVTALLDFAPAAITAGAYPQSLFGGLWYNDGADHPIPFDGFTGSFIMPAANVRIRADMGIALAIPASRPSGSFSLSPPLAEAFAYINANAVGGDEYTITMDRDESLDPVWLIPLWAPEGITVTLKGDGAERHVYLNSRGSLFSIGNGVTFILDEGITLHGRADNDTALVSVNGGGSAVMADSGVLVPVSGGGLVMNNGVKITGNGGGGAALYDGASFTMYGGEILENTFNNGTGGGVYVYNGDFTMSGGTISGNSSTGGGGVNFSGNGTFTMSGGTISGNTASNGSGGGVNFSGNGNFTMSGGTISGNTASNGGGGVQFFGGDFTMSGGTISGNTASGGGGGGVAFWGDGDFTMSEGTISGNSASQGGGVLFISEGDFTMTGGTISGNSAPDGGGMHVNGISASVTVDGGEISGNTADYGGGVSLDSGSFTMGGGIISGNTALYNGGGVLLLSNSYTFRKAVSGGVIYGSDALGLDSSGRPLKNTAGSNVGHAVFLGGSLDKRDTTAGVGIMLDSTISGAPGGWE
jgi:hypothetical protein